jgi:hypothetical protein
LNQWLALVNYNLSQEQEQSAAAATASCKAEASDSEDYFSAILPLKASPVINNDNTTNSSDADAGADASSFIHPRPLTMRLQHSDMIKIRRYWKSLSLHLDYLNPSDLPGVRLALVTAFKCHRGQRRRSGEDYIIHPIAVALKLAELRMDKESIQAGLLHDTVEDCDLVWTLELSLKVRRKFQSYFRQERDATK